MRRSIFVLVLVIAVVLNSGVAFSQTVFDMTTSAASQGWTSTIYGGASVAYTGQSIKFITPASPDPAACFLDAPPVDWAATVIIGKFSVRAEMVVISEFTTDPSIGITEIVASTGTFKFLLDFFTDQIKLSGGSYSGTTQYVMDTTDAAHVYELNANGPNVIVWVDGIERLNATALSTTTEQGFRFGDVYGANYGTSEWFALSYGFGGVVPTESSSWSDLKTNYRQ